MAEHILDKAKRLGVQDLNLYEIVTRLDETEKQLAEANNLLSQLNEEMFHYVNEEQNLWVKIQKHLNK